MRAPWVRKMILDDRLGSLIRSTHILYLSDDGNYVIPNIESVVTGGTHQLGDWDTVRPLNIASNLVSKAKEPIL